MAGLASGNTVKSGKRQKLQTVQLGSQGGVASAYSTRLRVQAKIPGVDFSQQGDQRADSE